MVESLITISSGPIRFSHVKGTGFLLILAVRRTRWISQSPPRKLVLRSCIHSRSPCLTNQSTTSRQVCPMNTAANHMTPKTNEMITLSPCETLFTPLVCPALFTAPQLLAQRIGRQIRVKSPEVPSPLSTQIHLELVCGQTGPLSAHHAGASGLSAVPSASSWLFFPQLWCRVPTV